MKTEADQEAMLRAKYKGLLPKKKLHTQHKVVVFATSHALL